MPKIPAEASVADVDLALEAIDESVYLYIGDEHDEGWAAAEAAAGALAGLQIFLIAEADRDQVAHWIEVEPLLDENPVDEPSGVLFGYGEEPWVFLSWDQAQSAKKLLKWLRRAEQET
jgi:hypothetical protein